MVQDNGILLEVREILEKEIQPYLHSHGGHIELVSIKDGVLTVSLKGACQHCPSAQITNEEIVKKAVLEKLGGQISDVRLFSEVSDETWAFAKQILNKSSCKGGE